MIIDLQRAFSPEDCGYEVVCGICRMDFCTGTVIAQVATDYRMDMGHACPACIEYLGKRNPECFPTIEEYEELLKRYPEPIWPTREGSGLAEDEGTFEAA